MNIAAFFDVDGTLLPPPSLEHRFLRFLRWRGDWSIVHEARWLARFLWRLPQGWRAAMQTNKAHLAGVRVAMVEAWTRSLGWRPLPLFSAALQRMEWHAAQGHRIFLVTGTPRPLAEALARQLPVPAKVCATQLELREVLRGGRTDWFWTGEVVGEAICGPAKARASKQVALEQDIDLALSYAYGNDWRDRGMLESVGHPAAVNPSLRLAKLARRRSWAVLEWHGVRGRPRARGATPPGKKGGPANQEMSTGTRKAYARATQASGEIRRKP